MADRIDLQNKLEELLGSRNVYYNPPENIKMEYPCIRYSKMRPRTNHADDKVYFKNQGYQLVVIGPKINDRIVEKLLELQYCSYDRCYKSDNLNHDVLTIYY